MSRAKDVKKQRREEVPLTHKYLGKMFTLMRIESRLKLNAFLSLFIFFFLARWSKFKIKLPLVSPRGQ